MGKHWLWAIVVVIVAILAWDAMRRLSDNGRYAGYVKDPFLMVVDTKTGFVIPH